jgi:hypothetical protein
VINSTDSPHRFDLQRFSRRQAPALSVYSQY